MGWVCRVVKECSGGKYNPDMQVIALALADGDEVEINRNEFDRVFWA